MARTELFYDRKRNDARSQRDLLMEDRILYQNKKMPAAYKEKECIPEPFKLPVTSRRSKNDFPPFLLSLYAHKEHPVKTSGSKTKREVLRGCFAKKINSFQRAPSSRTKRVEKNTLGEA